MRFFTAPCQRLSTALSQRDLWTSDAGTCLPAQQVPLWSEAGSSGYSRFATFLMTLGFTEAKSDTSLFIYRRGDETAYLLLYVDDIVLTASSQ